MRFDLEQFLTLTMALGTVGAIGVATYTNMESRAEAAQTSTEEPAPEPEPFPEAEPDPPPAPAAEPAPTKAPAAAPMPEAPETNTTAGEWRPASASRGGQPRHAVPRGCGRGHLALPG